MVSNVIKDDKGNAIMQKRFRPLAGKRWYLTEDGEKIMGNRACEFPSPCGEKMVSNPMVLKLLLYLVFKVRSRGNTEKAGLKSYPVLNLRIN